MYRWIDRLDRYFSFFQRLYQCEIKLQKYRNIINLDQKYLQNKRNNYHGQNITMSLQKKIVTMLMFLSLETLTSIIRTGLPILVELIDLMN